MEGSGAGLQRTMTMPALQRHMSGGVRPGWNLQVSSLDSPGASAAASPAISPSSSVVNPAILPPCHPAADIGPTTLRSQPLTLHIGISHKSEQQARSVLCPLHVPFQ